MDNDILKSFQSPEIPENPSITVFVQRGPTEDTIRLSQCVDPIFDMNILAEGLATAIVVTADYTEEDVEKIYGEVTHIVHEAVKFHGKIKRYD